MKSITLKVIAINGMLSLGLVACSNSSQDKVNNAQEKVDDAKSDVVDAKEDLVQAKKDSASEYEKYKADIQVQLQENDKKIADLKAKIKSDKKEINAKYEKQLNDAQDKNAMMKTRIREYHETSGDKWEEFKYSFNQDMDKLGKSISEMAHKNMDKN
jgi:chromosome segregation ATPase